MTVLKERQLEAWENRLKTYPKGNIFLKDTSFLQAQILWEKSYEWSSGYHEKEMINIKAIQDMVLARLPREVHFLSSQEHMLLERLILQDGKTEIYDWEEAGAAESLVKRLWCSFEIEEDVVLLHLPQALHGPLAGSMDTKEHKVIRDNIFRFGATIHGLLYITGYLPVLEPLERFLTDVAEENDPLAKSMGIRYFKASFDYVIDGAGEVILVHPGLAEVEPVMMQVGKTGLEVIELSPEMMVGAMNGILPEEISIHRKMVGTLFGKVRPEYDPVEVAHDLRLLAKQEVSIEDMKQVLQSTLAGYPTKAAIQALESLKTYTPSWYGLGAAVKH